MRKRKNHKDHSIYKTSKRFIVSKALAMSRNAYLEENEDLILNLPHSAEDLLLR